LIALLAHPLLVEALRVHLVRQSSLVLLVFVLIVRGTRIPPPVRIVETRITPGISITATSVTVAVVPEPEAAEASSARMVEASRGE
jgi:hypothetical protein